VDRRLVTDFTDGKIIPVIPSLAYDAAGGWLNVNADTAACAVAAELRAVKLVMLTDTPGILRNARDPASLISRLDAAEGRRLVESGAVEGGMIPKVEACFAALRAGVGTVHVIDGRRPYSLLLEIFTDKGVGTAIVP
jgi:acetylglutamate kinase